MISRSGRAFSVLSVFKLLLESRKTFLNLSFAWKMLCNYGVFILLLLSPGCRQDMHDQAKYEPLEGSAFFGDDRSARALPEGTIARGHLKQDPLYYTGKNGQEFVTSIPIEINRDVLKRGQDRYNIFCTPCHDKLGTGDGMVVKRGFRKPPSFHIERLRTAMPGYYFDVMTNGFGFMSSYAEQISVKDRWAITAYIQALHLSQNASLQDVPEEERKKLESERKQ